MTGWKMTNCATANLWRPNCFLIDEIRGAFRHHYPRMAHAQEELPLGGSLGGDFGAEGALEAARK